MRKRSTAPPSNSEPCEQQKLEPCEQQKPTKQQNAGKTFGKRATMPVLQSDCYAEINLPDLPQWDPLGDDDKGGLKIDSTVVCVGKRRTGKSWALRNLMYLMKDKIPAGIVISQTDELNKLWRDYVPKKKSSSTSATSPRSLTRCSSFANLEAGAVSATWVPATLVPWAESLRSTNPPPHPLEGTHLSHYVEPYDHERRISVQPPTHAEAHKSACFVTPNFDPLGTPGTPTFGLDALPTLLVRRSGA